MKTKQYGRTFLESLPDCQILEESALDATEPSRPKSAM
jgi:hypothetical protein